MVDTGKYFVILVDSIGNGATSSPSNSKTQPLMKFPEFSIHDMVESERRLATEVLHLSHLHAVIGMSMGGMQAFAWAVLRSYREGRRRGQSPLRALRFGRAVARWRRQNGAAHS